MKNRIVCGLALAALLAFAPSAMAQAKIKWAHVYETSEPYHQQALWAAEEIARRTGGRYQVEVFPASTLGKETDINQALSLGTVDIIYTGMAFAGRTYPPMSIASGPFIFRDYAHWQAFRGGPVFREVAKGYEDKSGHKIVGYTYYGQRHITESLVTIVAGDTWKKLAEPDRKVFSDVLWEASTRATADIAAAEATLVGDFEKRGKAVVKVDRGPFIKAVEKAVTAPDAPWPKDLYQRVQAIR